MSMLADEIAVPPTIAIGLAAAAQRLKRMSASARLDAELLLAAVLQLSRTQLRTRDTQALGAAQMQAFESAILRRENGEPIAYILGEKEFWSLSLLVTPAVLVPRPETELLVEWALQCLKDSARPALADLGTGSGAIALALARERPDSRVIAIDSSAAALAVARRNAQALGLPQVEFRLGDWLAPLAHEIIDESATEPANERVNSRFDLLISNPPYLAEDDAHLPSLQHEPLQALISGVDGLDAIRHLVQHAPEHLKHGGWLLLEHGATQGAAVRDLFQARGYADVTMRCDLAGLERATGARWMAA
jgi:release factor glutamine methyltransferase